MENLIKTTIEVEVSKAKFLAKIMEKIHFKEVSTFPTGGLHSAPTLLITFQGDKKDYHERGYIRAVHKSELTKAVESISGESNDEILDLTPSTYYSIKFPSGIYAPTLSDFKQKSSYNDIDSGTYHEL